MLASKMKFRRLWILSVTLIACTAEGRQHAKSEAEQVRADSLGYFLLVGCSLLSVLH